MFGMIERGVSTSHGRRGPLIRRSFFLLRPLAHDDLAGRTGFCFVARRSYGVSYKRKCSPSLLLSETARERP